MLAVPGECDRFESFCIFSAGPEQPAYNEADTQRPPERVGTTPSEYGRESPFPPGESRIEHVTDG